MVVARDDADLDVGEIVDADELDLDRVVDAVADAGVELLGGLGDLGVGGGRGRLVADAAGHESEQQQQAGDEGCEGTNVSHVSLSPESIATVFVSKDFEARTSSAVSLQ